MSTIVIKQNNMRKLLFTLLISICLFNIHHSQYSIGNTTISFIDSSRSNRAIETEIYYPANTAGVDVAAATGSFPVIIFGHGFGMNVSAYQIVWEQLVPQGYIVALPTTETTIFGPDHQDFGFDLQFLVSAIQDENNAPGAILNSVIAPSVAIGGHSMGGGCAFLAVDSLQTDARVKTLFGFAPAESTTNGVSSINSATRITTPSVIFSGTADGVTPPNDHHIPMYDSLVSGCKTIINIVGGAHCYFANTNFNCDFGESTSSSGITVTRTEQQAITYSLLIPWLNYTLKDSCNGFEVFFDSLDQSGATSFTSTCNYDKSLSLNQNTLYPNMTGTNYQWYLNDSSISGAIGDSLVISSPGIYKVLITKHDGCSVFSNSYNYLTTQIDQLNKSNIILYPNPAQNILQISMGETVNLKEAELFNSIGEKEKISIINAQSLSIEHLQSGVYFLRLNNQTLSFIKE